MHVQSVVSAMEDGQGRPTGLLATIRDVTAQKEAEAERDRLLEEVRSHAGRLEGMVARRTAALQASQARLRAIFEGAAIGIALSDREGLILESNPAFQAMLGYSAEELRKLQFTDFTHPGDVTADRELFQDLVAGKRQEYRLDKRYVRKDGQIIWEEAFGWSDLENRVQATPHTMNELGSISKTLSPSKRISPPVAS
jgi:PAS domain S-box-containing protein